MQMTFARRPVAMLTVASMLAAAAASPASGWTDPNPTPFTMFRLFAPEAKLSADGRRLVVTGMADCGPAEGVVQVAVSVLQHETFASARGFSKEQPCTDAEDTFTAELTVKEGKARSPPARYRPAAWRRCARTAARPTTISGHLRHARRRVGN